MKMAPKVTPRTPRRREFTFDCALHGRRSGVTWTEDDHCPVCAAEAEGQRQAAKTAARRRTELEHLHRRLDLPPRFSSADLASHPCNTDKQRAAVATCQAFVDSLPNAGQGLFLIGPSGTGKTTLSAAICRAAIDQRGRSARLITQRELIRNIRATWHKGALTTEGQILEEYASAGVLVLDDAGVSHGGDSELVHLLDVIDGRYAHQRPTVVSSNLTVPALAKAFGDRVFNRLREGARFVVCDWPSHLAGLAEYHQPQR